MGKWLHERRLTYTISLASALWTRKAKNNRKIKKSLQTRKVRSNGGWSSPGPVKEKNELWSAFLAPHSISPLSLNLASSAEGGGVASGGRDTQAHTETYTRPGTSSDSEAQGVEMRSWSTRCRTQMEVLKWAKTQEVLREEDVAGKIGIGYTTHDKHIHPHYNNPSATHQCSISLPLSPSLTIDCSPSFAHAQIHCRSNTFQIDKSVPQKSWIPVSCTASSYVISVRQDKITFQCSRERFHANTSVRLQNKHFLWLPHRELIAYSKIFHGPWKNPREAQVGLRHFNTHIHTVPLCSTDSGALEPTAKTCRMTCSQN